MNYTAEPQNPKCPTLNAGHRCRSSKCCQKWGQGEGKKEGGRLVTSSRKNINIRRWPLCIGTGKDCCKDMRSENGALHYLSGASVTRREMWLLLGEKNSRILKKHRQQASTICPTYPAHCPMPGSSECLCKESSQPSSRSRGTFVY